MKAVNTKTQSSLTHTLALHSASVWTSASTPDSFAHAHLYSPRTLLRMESNECSTQSDARGRFGGKDFRTWFYSVEQRKALACYLQHNSFCFPVGGKSWTPWWNWNGSLETRTEAPQAATTELPVAGVTQWVRFMRNRWQEMSLMYLANHIRRTWKNS